MRSTLIEMGVGWERYSRTRKADRAFRREADGIDDYLVERLVSLRLEAAIDLRDPDAQEFLITRFDKAKQFAATMKLKREELKAAEKQAARDDVEATREALGLPRRKPPEAR